MKRLLFAPFLVILFVLFSCKNDFFSGAQGSISFDAGNTAEYLSRSATQNIASLQASNNPYDETSFVSYTIKVRIETEGDYKDSAENVYSKKLSEILNTPNQDQAIISFIKDSLSKPIYIKGIPVGSSIKVKLSITNTVSLDADAFKQSLAGQNLPPSYVDFLVDAMVQDAVSESDTWYGKSETFVVRRGENKVNIKQKTHL